MCICYKTQGHELRSCSLDRARPVKTQRYERDSGVAVHRINVPFSLSFLHFFCQGQTGGQRNNIFNRFGTKETNQILFPAS